MARRRVVIPELQDALSSAEVGAVLALPSAFVHYLCRVLRLEGGQSIELCDGRGARWDARLCLGEGDAADICLEARLDAEPLAFPIYLAQAIPKSDKMEQILQRCTELGVAGFYPFFSSRCVVKLTAARAARRLARWQRIVQEACRQSQRAWMPIVETPRGLLELQDQLPPGLPRLVCWAGAREQGLDDWIRAHPAPDGIVVFVGPEGGFAEAEIEALADAGVAAVGLGPAILRTETAGPAVAAILQFHYGALGSVG